MNSEHDEILMSMLADGELPSDQTNDLLLDVLDDAAGREKLKELLRLRQATAGWRASQSPRPVMVVTGRPEPLRPRRRAWRMGSLALAACLGGLLVLVGVGAARWLGSRQVPGNAGAVVTSEQMAQVSQAFALHESVAGPLAWYAADDQNIRLASARGAEAGRQPIAVLLKLERAAGMASPGEPRPGARTLVIVCRSDEPAVIELPAESADRPGLRVYLAPKASEGKVQMQYAIAADGLAGSRQNGDSPQPVLASLTGQRRLGLTETPLGQLAMGDSVLNVEAAAWTLPKEARP